MGKLARNVALAFHQSKSMFHASFQHFDHAFQISSANTALVSFRTRTDCQQPAQIVDDGGVVGELLRLLISLEAFNQSLNDRHDGVVVANSQHSDNRPLVRC